MLPKANQLKKTEDIKKVFKRGRAIKEDLLTLKILKSSPDKIRFCFIVSRKVSPKAVVRNKIKRRLREIIRLKLPKLKRGFDVIFLASPGLETKSFKEMAELINKLFLKINLYSS